MKLKETNAWYASHHQLAAAEYFQKYLSAMAAGYHALAMDMHYCAERHYIAARAYMRNL